MPVERTEKSGVLRQLTLTGKALPSGAKPGPSKTKAKSKPKPKEDDHRVFTDVILPIKSEFSDLIAKREKNHEYRKYALRETVERLWLYEVAPVGAITHVIHTARPKVPGEVNDPAGVGNDDFDAGKKKSKFGYPVLGLSKLQRPLTTKDMKARFGLTVPQSFCFATKQLVAELKVEDMERLF